MKNRKQGKFTEKPIEQHLQEYVFPEPNTGCWLWAGPMSNKGYGVLNINYKQYRAHRAVYSYYKEVELAPDTYLCHTCDNKLCVNPDHLFEGTTQDNMDDMVSKNRQAKGSKNGGHKLFEPQVLEIKKFLKEGSSLNSLARKYGVSQRTISFIRDGVKWGWLQ